MVSACRGAKPEPIATYFRRVKTDAGTFIICAARVSELSDKSSKTMFVLKVIGPVARIATVRTESLSLDRNTWQEKRLRLFFLC